MTHPITPPPELVQQWMAEPEYGNPGRVTLHTLSEPRLTQMLTRAAQWGADQELEACCEWLANHWWGSSQDNEPCKKLRAARRPKPSNLKEQALKVLNDVEASGCFYVGDRDTIRRALEALPD